MDTKFPPQQRPVGFFSKVTHRTLCRLPVFCCVSRHTSNNKGTRHSVAPKHLGTQRPEDDLSTQQTHFYQRPAARGIMTPSPHAAFTMLQYSRKLFRLTFDFHSLLYMMFYWSESQNLRFVWTPPPPPPQYTVSSSEAGNRPKATTQSGSLMFIERLSLLHIYTTPRCTTEGSFRASLTFQLM